VRETILGFVKKNPNILAGAPPLEEQDISAHVLNELFASPQVGSSSTIDYIVLYTIFQALEALGLISRKSDASGQLRFMNWLGFNNFRTKFLPIFRLSCKDSILLPPEQTKIEYHGHIDRFIKDLIGGALTKKREGSYLTKQELKPIKERLIVEGDTVGPVDSRKRLITIVKHIMVFTGMVEKMTTIDTNPESQADTQTTLGYKWVFPYTEDILSKSAAEIGNHLLPLTLNEREYLE
jgi:hypothetical protein